MGANPIGSNLKPRWSLIFHDQKEKDAFMGMLDDLARNQNRSRSAVVRRLVAERHEELVRGTKKD